MSTSSSTKYESKLIPLTKLNQEIEDAHKNQKKWVTVIDTEGNAEIFFKYQGQNYFSIAEKEMAPENLGKSVLIMLKYPRTLTINFLDLPYNNIFDDTFFPVGILDQYWIHDHQNIEKLRAHFLTEVPEEVYPCEDFKINFLFRKDYVPDILHEKTVVLEICPPNEIEEKLAERAAKKASEETKKEVEEQKTEDKSTKDAKSTKVTNSTSPKKPVVSSNKGGVTATKSPSTTGIKTSTTVKPTSTTTAKTTTSTVKSTTGGVKTSTATSKTVKK